MYLDYRGRIYNRDPYFSYQSNDLARAHFLFAEEKEVDQKGAEYTFIHIASSFNQTYTIDELQYMEWLELDYIKELESNSLVDISVDKMGVVDKHNWTIENIEKILDVAEQPLENLDYWMSAEKPWVFLSLCFEMGGIIGAALTGDSYYSSMPISIDGVNNGTQHLAAMSLDEKAGRLVGLTPMEIPKDFYLVMGKKILNLNKDTQIGEKLKSIPMKLIRKGISKRGSMTRAYDAGARKIGEIIFQDSYDAGITSKYNITRSDSRVLGKDLVNAYDSVCHGPVEIKRYLQALVKHKLENMDLKDISWDTPSGFPVLTQKWVARKKFYQGTLQKRVIKHVYLESTDKPALAEHLSAIGANWVHSYDASHMSLVINKLGYESFGAIHDSFSVHAANVEELIYTTKSEFIKMYAKDVFKDMQTEIIWNDKTFNEEVPELGKLLLEDIYESDFFFC
jgi:DNA-directed RNA polymerase